MYDDQNEIDERVLNRLKNKIVIKENDNLKTKEKSPQEMIKWIKKQIEEEIQCRSKK